MVNFVNPDSLGSLQVRTCGAHRTCASRWSLRCRACFPDQRVCSGFGCCFPHEALRSHLMCPPPTHTPYVCPPTCGRRSSVCWPHPSTRAGSGARATRSGSWGRSGRRELAGGMRLSTAGRGVPAALLAGSGHAPAARQPLPTPARLPTACLPACLLCLLCAGSCPAGWRPLCCGARGRSTPSTCRRWPVTWCSAGACAWLVVGQGQGS